MDEQLENINSTNDEDNATPETDEPKEYGLPADNPEVEPQDEALEDVEALRQKNQELYEQLRKAKGFKRDPKTGQWIKPEQKPTPVEKDGMAGITTEELYSLVRAGVPDEDTKEVKLYARSHGIDITTALKMEEVKSLLRVREEIRKSAEAAAISGSRRGSLKPTGDELIEKARSGQLPNTSKGMAEIARARIEVRKAERQQR